MTTTRHALRPLLAGTLALSIGCATAPDESPEHLSEGAFAGEAGIAAGDLVGTPAEPGDIPVGAYMVFEEAAPLAEEGKGEEPRRLAATTESGWILYMNRHGGDFSRAVYNDSRTNHSIVPKEDSTIEPWQVSDEGWQEVMSCVRDQFSRWDIVVTDQDPGDIPHMESVVAGQPTDLGLPKGIGGVSPFTSSCSTIPNSIVFTFAELFGDHHSIVCEVVAQEVAHSFGLDHEYLCEDPMSYLGGCGAKSFQQADAQCGEYEPRDCACGAATQNSVALLDERIGLAGTDNSPALEIVSPADGAAVEPGFSIRAIAEADLPVEVSISIDGILAGSDEAAPYELATDPALATGAHLIEVVATDAAGRTTTRTIEVVIDPDAPAQPTEPPPPGAPLEQLLGGCQLAGPRGGGGLWFLAAAAALLWRRRRGAEAR